MEKDERMYQLWKLAIHFAMILTGLLLIMSTLGIKAVLGISLIYLADKL